MEVVSGVSVDKSEPEQQSRRRVVAATGVVFGSAGCLSGSDESATPSASPTATPTPTDTASPRPSDAPTPTDTATPTETQGVFAGTLADRPPSSHLFNETDYPIGSPTWSEYVPNARLLLGRNDDHRSIGVRPIDSRDEWERVRRGHGSFSEELVGYPFVAETDFETESLVVFQIVLTYGPGLRFVAVDGVGSSTVRLWIERVGETAQNGETPRHLFVRVPAGAREIRRVRLSYRQSEHRIYTTSYP